MVFTCYLFNYIFKLDDMCNFQINNPDECLIQSKRPAF
jgi:hypothetical protein